MDSPVYIELAEIPSTNTFVQEHISELLDDYSVVFTTNQTAGRGMDTNSWEAEKGKNISFSILCRPTMVKPDEQFVLSMAIGVDVVKCLSKLLPQEAENFKVKWPNDIYWKDKKLGGILIENSLRGYRIGDCTIGIGLNINQETFLSDAPNPTSLKLITGEEHDGIALMKRIAERYRKTLMLIRLMEDTDSRSMQIAYDNIRADYHRMLWRNDDEMHGYSDSDSTFQARILRVQNDGRLLLRKDDGQEAEYWLKEVRFIL